MEKLNTKKILQLEQFFVDQNSVEPNKIDELRSYEWGKINYAIINKTQYFVFLSKLFSDYGKKLLISMKKFEELLIKALFRVQNKEFIEDFIAEIQQIPIKNFHVLLPIYNLQLTVEQGVLGAIPLIHYNHLEQYCLDNQAEIPNIFKNSFAKDKNYDGVAFVDITINARDFNYAEHQAKEKLSIIINVLNFMVGHKDKQMEISSERKKLGDEFFIGFGDTFFNISRKTDIKQPINFATFKQFAEDVKSGNNKILKLLSTENLNELEQRILYGVNWVGMSLMERNNAIALSEALFAVEALLQAEPGIINKSIVASLAEMVAFIVGVDYDSRIQLEEKFKNLYGLRSKITHGKGMNITDLETMEAISLARELIYTIIKKPAFKEAKSLKAINNYIVKMRYTVEEGEKKDGE